MPIIFQEGYYKPVEKVMKSLFKDLYWDEILEAIEESTRLDNSTHSLMSAIRKGRVTYKQGVFSGEFNSKVPRELSAFAKFNKVTKTWTGIPPASISAAASIANSRMEALTKKLSDLIEKIHGRVDKSIKGLSYGIEKPIETIQSEVNKDIVNLGLIPNKSPAMTERIMKEYSANMGLNIKDWTGSQVTNLRDMIQRNIESGYSRKELIQAIAYEYDVTMAKASFLARQETNLLMSTMRDERYQSAGIKYYRWSTSGDSRVVGNPGGLYPVGSPGHGNHWAMNGKICTFDDPTIYADSIDDAKAGKWKSKASIGGDNTHPGQAFNDRCSAIPLII